jgi:hypothetical protein
MDHEFFTMNVNIWHPPIYQYQQMSIEGCDPLAQTLVTSLVYSFPVSVYLNDVTEYLKKKIPA